MINIINIIDKRKRKSGHHQWMSECCFVCICACVFFWCSFFFFYLLTSSNALLWVPPKRSWSRCYWARLIGYSTRWDFRIAQACITRRKFRCNCCKAHISYVIDSWPNKFGASTCSSCNDWDTHLFVVKGKGELGYLPKKRRLFLLLLIIVLSVVGRYC